MTKQCPWAANKNRTRIKHLVLCLQICAAFFYIQPAFAQPDGDFDKASQSDSEMKAFVTSSTYGVLAGALVGAATLAFTENPSDHLRNVAKGASLGLYAGILLGVYVVYLVPGQMEEQRRKEEEQLGVKNFRILPDVQIAETGDATFGINSSLSF